MKSVIYLLLTVIMLSGCTKRTEYGQCIGMNSERDPLLTYEVSEKNIIIGVIFVETIFVPVLVALNEFYCPTGKSQEIKKSTKMVPDEITK